MDHPRFYIVLNWKDWRDTYECLESICKIDYNMVLAKLFILKYNYYLNSPH